MQDDLPDLSPSDMDLLYIGKQVQVKVSVDDVVYDVLGEISSSSEGDIGNETTDDKLEQYLLTNSKYSHSQVMACMKQMRRKQLEHVRNILAGGLPLALNMLDSDSSIEQAANELGPINMSQRSPQKCPAASSFTSDEGTDGSSCSKRQHVETEDDESEQGVRPFREKQAWVKESLVLRSSNLCL